MEAALLLSSNSLRWIWKSIDFLHCRFSWQKPIILKYGLVCTWCHKIKWLIHHLFCRKVCSGSSWYIGHYLETIFQFCYKVSKYYSIFKKMTLKFVNTFKILLAYCMTRSLPPNHSLGWSYWIISQNCTLAFKVFSTSFDTSLLILPWKIILACQVIYVTCWFLNIVLCLMPSHYFLEPLYFGTIWKKRNHHSALWFHLVYECVKLCNAKMHSIVETW